MTQYVLSLSYGKDSLACLGAIEKLGLPLDRIVHAEVWATDTIPADLPPMVEFKNKADAIIKERWGITVEHICATKPRERERESSCNQSDRCSYEDLFYRKLTKGKFVGNIKGFPMQTGAWCKKLKYEQQIDIRGYLLSTSQIPEGGRGSRIYGFPMVKGNWCTSDLKQRALRQSGVSIAQGNSKSVPSLRLSDLSPPRKLVHIPQAASFPTAPWHKVPT